MSVLTKLNGLTHELLATTEQMLVHVDMKATSASPIRPDVHAALNAIMAVHQAMPMPKQVGRQMTLKKKN